MFRRYVAEFLGTFALVFAGCGVRAMVGGDTQNFAGILLVHLTFGFTILAMTYTLKDISGAHFNPAMTLGFATARCFPFRYVLPYWLAQFLGAIAASALQFVLISDKATAAHYGATVPKVGIGQAIGIEIVLTFFLMFVNMGNGVDRRASSAAIGMAVGFTVTLDGLFGNSLTGGSMNPARSLGPALFAGSYALGSLWIYLLAPAIGAILAAVIYNAIRGGRNYAKGSPEELFPVVGDVPQVEAKEKGITEHAAS